MLSGSQHHHAKTLQHLWLSAVCITMLVVPIGLMASVAATVARKKNSPNRHRPLLEPSLIEGAPDEQSGWCSAQAPASIMLFTLGIGCVPSETWKLTGDSSFPTHNFTSLPP